MADLESSNLYEKSQDDFLRHLQLFLHRPLRVMLVGPLDMWPISLLSCPNSCQPDPHVMRWRAHWRRRSHPLLLLSLVSIHASESSLC
jgi:hypothetical protein